MMHEADRVSGSLFAYLGHFSQRQYLCAGHNDIDATGKMNNADDQNNYVASTEEGVAPGANAGAVGQFAAVSGEGNPL